MQCVTHTDIRERNNDELELFEGQREEKEHD